MPSTPVPTRHGPIAAHIEGCGPPLVLLHAAGHSHHDFTAITPRLGEHFRTIALDWPGHGDSPAPVPPSATSVSRLADALEDVVEALELPQAIFLGSSVGGTVSMRLAAKKPERVRGLVLVDSGGSASLTPFVRALCWIQGRELVRRATGMAFARSYMKVRGPGRDAVLAQLEHQRRQPGFIEADAAIWRSFGTPESDISSYAPQIQAPTCIVWGKRDPVIRANVEGARLRTMLPHASYVELDTGHLPFVEAPEAFLAAVEPFLDPLSALA